MVTSGISATPRRWQWPSGSSHHASRNDAGRYRCGGEPSDGRYSPGGPTLTLPLVGREIPIVADQHVDAEFGTGCVKVTPAHDPNDFAIGQRHGLPLITVMAKDGSMNSEAGRFSGLDRFEARKAVVAAMEEQGLLVKVEPTATAFPIPIAARCRWSRCSPPSGLSKLSHWRPAAVRPSIKPSPSLCRALEQGLPRLAHRHPRLVHQPPAVVGPSHPGLVCDQRKRWPYTDTTYVVARNEAEALEKARAQFGLRPRSSRTKTPSTPGFPVACGPFSTLGWPDQNAADLKRWYPTSLLVTGFDIIFFWVARMTMMAGAFTGETPFADVYIHGLVRDENNRKMSKSAGNGIDPLLLIDRYGADALRFALVREVAGAGQDIRLDYDRKSDTSGTVEASRNFANKLWNATRFALMNLGGETPASLGKPDSAALQLADRWILSRLAASTARPPRYSSYGLGKRPKASMNSPGTRFAIGIWS